MPSTIASVTDLIIDDFNSATELGEFTIPKLTDATSRGALGRRGPHVHRQSDPERRE
jgi:hypothetical protein